MTEIKQDVAGGSRVKVTNLDDVYVSSEASEAQQLPRLPDVVEEATAAANAPTFHSEPGGHQLFVFCLHAKGVNLWTPICLQFMDTVSVLVSKLVLASVCVFSVALKATYKARLIVLEGLKKPDRGEVSCWSWCFPDESSLIWNASPPS